MSRVLNGVRGVLWLKVAVSSTKSYMTGDALPSFLEHETCVACRCRLSARAVWRAGACRLTFFARQLFGDVPASETGMRGRPQPPSLPGPRRAYVPISGSAASEPLGGDDRDEGSRGDVPCVRRIAQKKAISVTLRYTRVCYIETI